MVWANILGGCMKWIYCRGGFTHFPPPPLEANTALLWSKIYTTIFKINVPPPYVVQLPTQKKIIWKTLLTELNLTCVFTRILR